MKNLSTIVGAGVAALLVALTPPVAGAQQAPLLRAAALG